MPARSLCQNFLNNILAPLHLYRQKSLIDATNAVINGASLTLTSIGRHLTGTASVKNKIKRVDRLLGNRHLQNEVSTIFQRITGNDSNLLIVFYVQIMPDDFVMQLHRF
ncbi:transposase [Escherichia coli]|nr:transposase [Escherichia coli]